MPVRDVDRIRLQNPIPGNNVCDSLEILLFGPARTQSVRYVGERSTHSSGRLFCSGIYDQIFDAYARLMRVAVNSELCQGHNRCFALAPELFDVDDYGSAVVIGDGEVSAELADKARLAMANCPEYAITIIDVAVQS